MTHIEGPILADWTLSMAAEIVTDVEATKNANLNRLRQLTDTSERGAGFGPDNSAVIELTEIVAQLADVEARAVKHLEKTMKAHPLGPWMKAQKGVGAKQCARLLATIRDPYWNDADDSPRTLRQLWRFCGLDVVPAGVQDRPDSQSADGPGAAPSKRKGQLVTWNPEARQRIWLIASKTVMFRDSGYRAVYDAGREKYAEAVHEAECKRCGPKGKPAQPGSALSAGHQHARAVRLVAKEILRDVWRESRRLHGVVDEETVAA